jgi:protein SCO1/2
MRNKVLIFWLALLMLFSGSMIFWMTLRHGKRNQLAVGQENAQIDYGPPLEGFQLTRSDGKQFDSKSMDGQVWVVNFFYSTCPTVCVQQNLRVQELEQEFAHRGVKFVSISCDATTDTPRRLADYTRERGFGGDDSWVFLTGKQEYIERIGLELFKEKVRFRGHSTRLVAIDRAGEIRGAFDHQNPAEFADLRALLGKLLAEASSLPRGEG